MTVFAERVVLLMDKQGLSQAKLAKRANITEAAMSNYVSGTRTPNSDVLVRIANALKTSTDYLLGNTNIDPSCNELSYIQRNLGKLNSAQLKKAESLLKTVFDDIWDEEE